MLNILGITPEHVTAQKMKSSIKEFFSKFFGSFLPIWSHLPKKFLMENLIFCTVSNFLTDEPVPHFLRYKPTHLDMTYKNEFVEAAKEKLAFQFRKTKNSQSFQT